MLLRFVSICSILTSAQALPIHSTRGVSISVFWESCQGSRKCCCLLGCPLLCRFACVPCSSLSWSSNQPANQPTDRPRDQPTNQPNSSRSGPNQANQNTTSKERVVGTLCRATTHRRHPSSVETGQPAGQPTYRRSAELASRHHLIAQEV
ncbi:hypothetical protein BKA80DRAFT_268791, partial [Phyllosticta citrichinensis]